MDLRVTMRMLPRSRVTMRILPRSRVTMRILRGLRRSILPVVCGVLLAGAAGAAPRLADVRVEDLGAETVVWLDIEDGTVTPSVDMLPDHRLVVDLPAVQPALRSHEVAAGASRLVRIRVGIHVEPARTRVVLDLTGPADFEILPSPRGLQIDLRAPGAPRRAERPEAAAVPAHSRAPAPAGSPAPARTGTPAPAPSASPSPSAAAPPPSPGPEEVPGPGAGQEPDSADAVDAPAPPAVAEPTAPPSGEAGWEAPPGDDAGGWDGLTEDESRAPPPAEPAPSGLVTIDFRDADVRAVIDLIANVGGYDVIFTPEVEGAVTVRLVDQPWETALGQILEKKRLRATRHADLILISPDEGE